MRDKLETYIATTLAAAVVLSPVTLTVLVIEYVIKIISVLQEVKT